MLFGGSECINIGAVLIGLAKVAMHASFVFAVHDLTEGKGRYNIIVVLNNTHRNICSRCYGGGNLKRRVG